MKGTKLWQAPGSPIIQGRSRSERPFWERWLTGVLGAEVALVGYGVALTSREPGIAVGAAAAEIASSLLLPGLPGVVLGSAFGVWFSRTMGWRRRWLGGAVVGVLGAAITIAAF